MAEEKTQEKPIEEPKDVVPKPVEPVVPNVPNEEPKPKAAFDVLTQAAEINKSLSENISKYEQLVHRQENLAAIDMLSGKASAGTTEEKPKTETPQEYAEKVRAGLINPLK